MSYYDRRLLTAPDWMKDFSCIAGDCPESCCQRWNIDVDSGHAESYTHLGDPELQSILDRLLHKIRVRHPGKRQGETLYRLQLLKEPDERCPLLNERGECRLQKKYGAYILCDTCYFHPRTFWQIDDHLCMSACLSCPECARLALLHREPAAFLSFEAEIDPGAEWLVTSLMTDPDAAMLMRNRETVVASLCMLLQQRGFSIRQRLARAVCFLKRISKLPHPDGDDIRKLAEKMDAVMVPIRETEDPTGLMKVYLAVFDPVGEALEKGAQGAAEFTRLLAGGRDGYASVLAGNYSEGCRIMEPFLIQNEHLIENFMVHYVFSDSFKQFYRCQNGPLSVPDILRHEAALLRVWYLFLRVQLAQTALMSQGMDEARFLKTVISADKTWWHYPDWFARCADRYADLMFIGDGKPGNSPVYC